jgi:hypothetical protein
MISAPPTLELSPMADVGGLVVVAVSPLVNSKEYNLTPSP